MINKRISSRKIYNSTISRRYANLPIFNKISYLRGGGKSVHLKNISFKKSSYTVGRQLSRRRLSGLSNYLDQSNVLLCFFSRHFSKFFLQYQRIFLRRFSAVGSKNTLFFNLKTLF